MVCIRWTKQTIYLLPQDFDKKLSIPVIQDFPRTSFRVHSTESQIHLNVREHSRSSIVLFWHERIVQAGIKFWANSCQSCCFCVTSATYGWCELKYSSTTVQWTYVGGRDWSRQAIKIRGANLVKTWGVVLKAASFSVKRKSSENFRLLKCLWHVLWRIWKSCSDSCGVCAKNDFFSVSSVYPYPPLAAWA